MATSVASSIAPRTSDARQIRSRETELAPVRLSGQNLVAVVAGEQIGQVGGGRYQRRLTRRRSGGELPVRSEESARETATGKHGRSWLAPLRTPSSEGAYFLEPIDRTSSALLESPPRRNCGAIADFAEIVIHPQFRETQSSVTTSLTSMLPRVAFE